MISDYAQYGSLRCWAREEMLKPVWDLGGAEDFDFALKTVREVASYERVDCELAPDLSCAIKKLNNIFPATATSQQNVLELEDLVVTVITKIAGPDVTKERFVQEGRTLVEKLRTMQEVPTLTNLPKELQREIFEHIQDPRHAFMARATDTTLFNAFYNPLNPEMNPAHVALCNNSATKAVRAVVMGETQWEWDRSLFLDRLLERWPEQVDFEQLLQEYRRDSLLDYLRKCLSVSLAQKVTALDLSGCRNLSPSALNAVAQMFPNITSLNLSGVVLQDEHIKQLAHFKNLKDLDASNTCLNDARIPLFKDITNLTSLNISKNIQITGSSFDSLPASLVKLDASNCNLTNMCDLKRLIHLTELIISENRNLAVPLFNLLPLSLVKLDAHLCSLCDDEFEGLERLQHLTQLFIQDNRDITGSRFDKLPPSLVTFAANNCSLDDDCITHLAGLAHLNELYLSGNHLHGTHFDLLPTSLTDLDASECALMDNCLRHLLRLQDLKTLDISDNSNLSTEAVEAFVSQLPPSVKVELPDEEA